MSKGYGGRFPRPTERGLREPLSQSEIRVLRYLPTKLSALEIADQLYLSVNTVQTHMRHLYDKLGVHRRHPDAQHHRNSKPDLLCLITPTGSSTVPAAFPTPTGTRTGP
jgi:DNA-binding CsgD family transcriptional regulator